MAWRQNAIAVAGTRFPMSERKQLEMIREMEASEDAVPKKKQAPAGKCFHVVHDFLVAFPL